MSLAYTGPMRPLPRPVVLHVPIGKGCNNRCRF